MRPTPISIRDARSALSWRGNTTPGLPLRALISHNRFIRSKMLDDAIAAQKQEAARRKDFACP